MRNRRRECPDVAPRRSFVATDVTACDSEVDDLHLARELTKMSRSEDCDARGRALVRPDRPTRVRTQVPERASADEHHGANRREHPVREQTTHQLADVVPVNALHRDVKCSVFKLCVGDARDVRMMQE